MIFSLFFCICNRWNYIFGVLIENYFLIYVFCRNVCKMKFSTYITHNTRNFSNIHRLYHNVVEFHKSNSFISMIEVSIHNFSIEFFAVKEVEENFYKAARNYIHTLRYSTALVLWFYFSFLRFAIVRTEVGCDSKAVFWFKAGVRSKT